MRVLLVEDEKGISSAICQVLKKENFSVDPVYTGTDGLDYALTENYDAVVLDVMLPEMDGFQVLKKMREQGVRTPVCMLTARAGKEEKPVMALSFGDVELNAREAKLSCSATGQSVKLGGKEYQLMELLLRNPRQILPRETLFDRVWGYDSEAEYGNLEVYLSFLRKKLVFVGSRVKIRATRGVGYSLEEEA